MRVKNNNSNAKRKESESEETVCSALEPYCPECDVIYKCEEVLIFREHCKVEHGLLWCTSWHKGSGCEFATTKKDELRMHMETCQDKGKKPT